MRYYADLNPRFPARGEKRWGVFIHRDDSNRRSPVLQFATRAAAERNAAKLIQQERDEELPYGY